MPALHTDSLGSSSTPSAVRDSCRCRCTSCLSDWQRRDLAIDMWGGFRRAVVFRLYFRSPEPRSPLPIAVQYLVLAFACKMLNQSAVACYPSTCLLERSVGLPISILSKGFRPGRKAYFPRAPFPARTLLSLSRGHRNCASLHSTLFFSYSCALFCTFLHLQKTYPFCFQAIPHSLQKKHEGWGPPNFPRTIPPPLLI